MASSGLHSNGYSLVRHVLLDATAGWALDRDVPELGRTLGEELLEPTRIYAKACLDARAGRTRTTRCPTSPVAASPANLARVLPVELSATIDRATWTPRRSSTWSAGWATSPSADLEATLNCGVGMVALVGPRRRRRGDPVLGRARGPRLGGGRGRRPASGRRRLVELVGAAPRLVTPPLIFDGTENLGPGVREQPGTR